MTDIVVGLVLMTGIALLLTYSACRLSERLLRWQCDALAALVVGATFAYIHWVWYSVRLAEWLPFSNLIVIGNWFPLFAAVLLGLIWKRLPGGVGRRGVNGAALIGAAGATMLTPFVGSSPDCRNEWSRDGFCLQTSDASCSAACAASVLQQAGIASTEQEMARLCFSGGGTTWLGLYRGLKLKTANTPWDVRVVDLPADELAALTEQPLILSVGIEREARVDGAFARETGWRPGFRHSVLLLGETRSGTFEIADPSPQIGRERWSPRELEMLYRGPAMQLVRR